MTTDIPPVLFESLSESFIVHFRDTGTEDYKMSWEGAVFPVDKFDNGDWYYIGEETEDHVTSVKDARCWFDFSFCWRGVWEGRIYHKQEEFDGEDLMTIADVWKQIEKLLKERIKNDNPDYGSFDE